MMTRSFHPTAATLLTLLLAQACGSDNSTGPGDNGTPALPAELVGTWRLAQAGEPVCDPDTGECVQSYARSETLELTGGGNFDHSLFFESHLPPCSLVVHHQSNG